MGSHKQDDKMESGRLALLTVSIYLAISLTTALNIGPVSVRSHSITQEQDVREFTPSKIRQKRAVFSGDDQVAILDKHNTMRRNPLSSNMNKLEWSADLASMAEEWAKGCDFQPGQVNSTDMASQNIGQNRYAVFGSFDALNAVDEWWSGKTFYNTASGTCAEGQECDSYLQMAWGETNEVGCAFAFCSDLKNSDLDTANYLVCNYHPAGAWAGSKPYKTGPQCSECSSGKGWCSDGLCSDSCAGQNCECKAYCRNCGVKDDDDCSCECKPGFLGPSCSEKCADAVSYCGTSWTSDMCTADHQYVLDSCPRMCNLCTAVNVYDEECEIGTTTPDPRVNGGGALVPGPTTKGYEADFIPIYFEPAVDQIMWVGIALGIICVLINIFGLIFCCGCRKGRSGNSEEGQDNKMYVQE